MGDGVDAVHLGAGAIIIRDGKTLLAKRKNTGFRDGTWGSFGGHVEFGESITKTIAREAREELGIEIGNLRFLYCSNIVKDGKHYFDISFLADIVSGEPRIVDTDRIETIGWFPIDALPTPLFEPVQFALDAYHGGPSFREVHEI